VVCRNEDAPHDAEGAMTDVLAGWLILLLGSLVIDVIET
jgi:hypothetical protein